MALKVFKKTRQKTDSVEVESTLAPTPELENETMEEAVSEATEARAPETEDIVPADAKIRTGMARRHFFLPPIPPKQIEETGLSISFLINLTAKVLQAGGTMTPTEISDVIKLPKLVARQLIKEMQALMLVESQGLESESIKSDIRYSLTDLGKKWALDALQISQYVGPAPVTLEMFEEQVRIQRISNERIHREELDKAFSHLVIPDILKAQLGPGANSGRSMLLYGEAGNGKTSLSEALGKSFIDVISFPYAVIVGNQIIRFFDETLHHVVVPPEGTAHFDRRWVPCRRPVVIAGGELTLDMLDLRFEQTARFYEAPMHLKALGGIFVLDDFGRQAQGPQDFLNRWIVPLEKGFDILSLHTGKKFRISFDQLVVFSSNKFPEELGDDAAQRRIYFKIHVPSPTKEDYLQIFKDVCDKKNLDWNDDVMEEFYTRKYEKGGYVTSGAHPGFLVHHIFAACRYLDQEPELSLDLLELAWRNVSVSKTRNKSS